MNLPNLKLLTLTNYHNNSIQAIFAAALIFFAVFSTGCQMNLWKEKSMSNSSELEVIQEFRERLNQENLEGINLTYRISGGMPAETQINEEFRVSENNLATVRRLSSSHLPQEAATEFTSAEVQSLLQQVEQGIDSLVPRSEARFLPDSVIGSITLEINGERATYYFLVDEEERQNQNKPITPAMAEVIARFSHLSQRLWQQGGN